MVSQDSKTSYKPLEEYDRELREAERKRYEEEEEASKPMPIVFKATPENVKWPKKIQEIK